MLRAQHQPSRTWQEQQRQQQWKQRPGGGVGVDDVDDLGCVHVGGGESCGRGSVIVTLTEAVQVFVALAFSLQILFCRGRTCWVSWVVLYVW